MASINARRALACAIAMALPCADARSEMLESDSSPTAMTVNKIINESVMTSAKPVRCGRTNTGCFIMTARNLLSAGSP